MEAPDKIYVPIVNLGIEEGEHTAPLWWNKDKKSEHPDVAGTIEYIRKDAILEWAKKMKTANETYVDKDEPETTQWYKHGAYHICNELIDKLDSL